MALFGGSPLNVMDPEERAVERPPITARREVLPEPEGLRHGGVWTADHATFGQRI